MTRGLFNFLSDIPTYNDAPKSWYVNVEHSDMFWYELLIGELPSMLESKPVQKYLKVLSENVAASLEKRFIYFVVTQTRLRFVENSLTWHPLRRAFRVKILVGADRQQRVLQVPWQHRVWPWSPKPRIDFDARLMTFWEGNSSHTWSIHELMTDLGLKRDEPTKVQYVGKTEEPHKRLGGLRHERLSQISHQTAEHSDTFLMVNLFKAVVQAPAAGLIFVSTNAMTDEVTVEREADVIECAFVCYFRSKYQCHGEGNEHGTLRNRLRDMLKDRNIREIVFDLELAEDLQSDLFCSDAVEMSRRHIFRCSIRDGQTHLERLPEDFDVMGWWTLAREGEPAVA